MTELPEGWVTAPLGELAVNRDRERVPVNAKVRSARSGVVPYYGAAGQVGWIDRPLFDDTLLLLGEDGVQFFDADKSKAYMITGPSWVNNHAHVLGECPGVDLTYLMHFLNQFDYHGYANGTTRLKLTRSSMDEIPIRLAPLAEQEWIVAAIEEAFSKLDAGEAGLRTVRQLLKRMRDAVLAAAVTGRLVPQDPSDTPASKLLSDLAVDVSAGSNGGLPDSWERLPLGHVAEVRLGRQRSPERATGPRMRPYLRAANVGWSGLRLDDVKEMSFTEAESEIFDLVRGDLLLSEASGSPGEVGKPAQYRDEVDGGCCFQNTLIRVRLRAGLDPDYYEHFFRNEARTGRFAAGSRGVGIHHLGQKALNEWLVPVPPPEEQARIVAEVERQLSDLAACERAVDVGLARAAALRRSVLKAAFAGKLVAQDPSDEPASALLDRIRAERAAAPKSKERRARTTA